ncbi:hypothetical protein DL95DRAFT_379301 [Leptodontidium sp. 2 PMI_412]|nr:hypothetical protein DL95DRAFT_379301 [Leptodontidium sp. 2 PMI_412]
MSQVLPAVARSPPHTYPVDRGVGCSVQIGAIHLVKWVDRMKGVLTYMFYPPAIGWREGR